MGGRPDLAQVRVPGLVLAQVQARGLAPALGQGQELRSQHTMCSDACSSAALLTPDCAAATACYAMLRLIAAQDACACFLVKRHSGA